MRERYTQFAFSLCVALNAYPLKESRFCNKRQALTVEQLGDISSAACWAHMLDTVDTKCVDET